MVTGQIDIENEAILDDRATVLECLTQQRFQKERQLSTRFFQQTYHFSTAELTTSIDSQRKKVIKYNGTVDDVPIFLLG